MNKRTKKTSQTAFTKKRKTTQRRKAKVTRPSQGYVRSSNVPLPTGRILFMMFCICLLFIGVSSRLVWMSLTPAAEPRASLRTIPTKPHHRGDIYDRNGILLATTLKSYSLFADPKRMIDPQESLARLGSVIPELYTEKTLRKISNPRRRFVWLKRRMSPEVAHRVNNLGIPGLAFRIEHVRIYPHKNLFSHTIGATNVDGKGLAGVERSQNDKLTTGEDVHLSLDINLQEQLRESVLTAMKRSEAKAAWGVVTNPQTGDIVAMTSLPDFDPHNYGNEPANAKFNRPTLGVYEMGSTFKLFTLAQGLEAGIITPETEIDASKPIKIGRFTIRDFHAKKRILTAQEVLRYSSNIGAAKIADELGPQHQQSFMSNLGFLTPINVDIPEIGRPLSPAHWRRIQTLTVSFGHGIAVTPMHLMAAVGALVTDGTYKNISVLKDHVIHTPRRIISPTTVAQVKDLMEDVVLNGSGRNSRVDGLHSGGKTGTAEKVGSKGYSESKNLVSFISAAPLDNPKLLTLIMLDEPNKAYATGGRIAAPAVRDFQTKALPLLSIPIDLKEARAARNRPMWPVYR